MCADHDKSDDIKPTGTQCGEPCIKCGRPCAYLGGKTHDGRLGGGGIGDSHKCDRHIV